MNLSVIKEKCEKTGMTFAALEKATGLGNGIVAKWENGNPRIDNIKKVADYFGCTIDELLKEEYT